MSSIVWWRSVLNLLKRKSTSHGRRRRFDARRSTYRIWFETLEDRFAPATTGWANTGGGSWGTGSNWVGGSVPPSTNDVSFPAGAYSVTLDAAQSAKGVSFAAGANVSIASGSGANTLTIGADGITETGASAITDSIAAKVALGAAQTWNAGSGNALTVSGAVANGGNLLTVSGAGNTTISGAISGSGSLTKAGGGTLTLSGNNTYSSGTTINAGTIQAQNNNALGNLATETVKLNANATALQLAGNITLTAAVTNSNTQANILIVENVSGNNQATITQLTNSTWNFISDQDNLTISSTGAANVGAGSSFTTNGAGNVTLTNNGTRQIFGANTNLTANGTGTLSVTGNYSILVGTVAINSGATMLLGNGGSTNGTANQTGAVTDNGTLIFAISGAAGQTGVISGNGTVIQSGGVAGTLTLNQNNTYTGGTTVSSGTLAGINSQASSITASSGSTLAPGISSSSTGILSVSNSVTLNGNSTFNVQLNGATVGSKYDQLNVTGSGSIISLGGANLNVTLAPGFTPPTGTAFTIINNGGSIPITVPFNGLPEGALVPLGGHPFFISYRGGSGKSVVLTAGIAATTTTVTSSVNPSVFGQSVTFTATVSSGGGTPTGMVTFKEGASTLAVSPLISGVATFTAPSSVINTVATHTITASYSGDINFTSSSGSVLQTVNQACTATVVTAAPNPSLNGQPVTFTATVSAVTPGTGTPTGTVTFMDGSTSLSTGGLGNGTATFSTSSLPAALHNIAAVYGGDTNFTGGTAATLVQQVQYPTSAGLVSSATSVTFGTVVTFTATITDTTTPAGNVTFLDGANPLAVSPLDSSGTATFSTSSLPGGTHTIGMIFGGVTTWATSSAATLLQTVTPASTATTVVAPNPSLDGAVVAITATVTGIIGFMPVGTVTFLDGGTLLGTSLLNSDRAGLTTSLSAGSHTLTAVYGGDGNFKGSTSATSVQTVRQSTTATVSSSANPALAGSSVTFTGTVSGSSTPTGTLTFEDGGTSIGTATLSGGTATLTTSSLTAIASAHTITAIYGGDSNFAGSTSDPLAQTISRSDTSDAYPTVSLAGNALVLFDTGAGTGSFSGSGSFTDVDSTSWTATVNYGDGSGDQALTIGAGNTLSPSHSYSATGTYTVTVTVTDDGGSSGVGAMLVSVAAAGRTGSQLQCAGLAFGSVGRAGRRSGQHRLFSIRIGAICDRGRECHGGGPVLQWFRHPLGPDAQVQ